nr:MULTISPECIES: aldehyde dehydrogenase family protein [Streptomyces]
MSPAAPPTPSVVRHWIGGEAADAADGRTLDVTDPVSNRPYAQVARGGPADVAQAVDAARAVFPAWAATAHHERARVLHRIADAVEDRHDRLAVLESYDSGLPIGQARGQTWCAAENFRHFAGVITTLGEEAFRQGEEQLSYVVRSPAGVAGLITPWNTPFMLQSWKLAPALAAGCTVVLKPPSGPRCRPRCGRRSSPRRAYRPVS